MSRSVPSPSEVQATFVATLFDEWIRHGLRDVVIAPGSRSTPLALAATQRDELQVHVRLDERGAGFFALGRSLATRTPVAIVVTSGTAATELHACVAEADLAGVALLVVTSDRPPELHGVGAPQTLEQGYLFGSMVRRYEDPGVARWEASHSWRPLASRAWHSARGDDAYAGPVHLNVPFIEPLVASPHVLPEGRRDLAAWRHVGAARETLTELDVAGSSVLCVVGAGVDASTIDECRALNWVVLGDATSQKTMPYYDALLRSPEFATNMRPDVVVRMGGLVASKVLNEQIRAWATRVVGLSSRRRVADPDAMVSATYAGVVRRGVPALYADGAYVAAWRRASNAVGVWLDDQERDELGATTLNEPLVARAVVRASNDLGAALVVGSSMPVRDVEWWSAPRRVSVYANRGANGIDGVVSTLLGVAVGSKAIGLVGDLTMLHDVSALVDGLGDAGGSCVLVVNDNRGGGIFSFLPQASAVDHDRFERLFGTPRHVDLQAVAASFGYRSLRVSTLSALRSALEEGLTSEGLSVIVAAVPSRLENVKVHRAWNESVVNLVSGVMT